MIRLHAIFLLWCCITNVWANDTVKSSTLILDKNNIKIWTYKVPNSAFSGFLAKTAVKSTLSGLVALVTDTQNASRWLYRTSQIDVLARDDTQQNFTIRVLTDFPWPFTDREALVDVRISQDSKGQVRIDSNESADAGKYLVGACCLRMPVVKGYWLFKSLPNGMVEVSMSGHADPGGRIPVGAVNFLIQEHPYNTLMGLQKTITDDKYQKTLNNYIKEPL